MRLPAPWRRRRSFATYARAGRSDRIRPASMLIAELRRIRRAATCAVSLPVIFESSVSDHVVLARSSCAGGQRVDWMNFSASSPGG